MPVAPERSANSSKERAVLWNPESFPMLCYSSKRMMYRGLWSSQLLEERPGYDKNAVVYPGFMI